MSLLLISSGTGCSLIFVKTPANDGNVSSRLSGGNCTSSRVAPALDTTFATLQLVRTGLAASASDSVYDNPKAPLSREADIALGAGFMALFTGSAIYGFVNTSRCSRLKRGGDGDQPSAPDPAETWATTTPVTRPVPSSSPPQTSTSPTPALETNSPLPAPEVDALPAPPAASEVAPPPTQ